MDLAAEQVGQLTADRKTQPRAAVFAAGAGVGLHEGLENHLLLFLWNADAGVADLERNDRRRLFEHGMSRAPAALDRRNAQAHAALGGELEGVREQVLEHLLQALGVGGDAASEIGVEIDLERQLPGLGFVTERARHHVEQVRERYLLRIHGHRAGFDLGEVENVADQVQEIGAGAVNGARELDLLEREIAVGVVRELLTQDQDAVERRAQLVRHVGEELRLVFRRQRELGCLFL